MGTGSPERNFNYLLATETVILAAYPFLIIGTKDYQVTRYCGSMTTDPFADLKKIHPIINAIGSVAIWATTEIGEIEFVAGTFEEIWGVPPEEGLDVEVLDQLVHPEDREKARKRFDSELDDISKGSFEHRILQPDGSLRWVKNRFVPLYDDGELKLLVGLNIDITEQKKREEDLKTLNGIFRHDISNSLMVIDGWLSILEEELDDKHLQPVERAQSATQDAENLLEFSGEYMGLMATREAEPSVSLDSVLSPQIETQRDANPQATIRMTGDDPFVDVEGNELLESVFRNTISNAVTHNDKPSPEVGVDVEVGKTEALVRILDNGPGIPPGEISSIFDKQFKSENSSGTGMGLYLTEQILHTFNGEISVENNDSEGVTFEIRLNTAL